MVGPLHPHQGADDIWKVFLPSADHRRDDRYANEARRDKGQHVWNHVATLGVPRLA
jgi:hypothetical protein